MLIPQQSKRKNTFFLGELFKASYAGIKGEINYLRNILFPVVNTQFLLCVVGSNWGSVALALDAGTLKAH